ncbi:MAG: hypothetical protein ACK6CP_14080 [Pseudanabaena sp.]|nr:hypothetical protein [Pseudanabaena sp. M109S1SP2A07QC]MCE2887973.1 hypothetical protein [Pseudanabaena sp. 42896M_M3]
MSEHQVNQTGFKDVSVGGNFTANLDQNDVPRAESIPDVAMPIDPRVRVLVTTRERELNVGFESVPLKVLSEEKALELLRKIAGVAKVDKELGLSLLRFLDGLGSLLSSLD